MKWHMAFRIQEICIYIFFYTQTIDLSQTAIQYHFKIFIELE